MRIALVVHDYHRQGGHSRYTAELAERFSAWGHETHVFANGFPQERVFFPKPAREGQSLYLHRVPSWRRAALGTVLTFFWPASRAIRRFAPFDIVHGQGFTAEGCNLLTAHICCAAWHEQRLRSGHALRFREKFFDWVVTRIEKRLFGKPNSPRTIAISKRVDQDLRNFYGRTQPTVIIPHGVDCQEFDVSRKAEWRASIRSSLGIAEDRFLALWVGDLRKGFTAAMQAVAQNPGQALLAVARNYTQDFAQQGEQLGISDRLTFLGPTNEIAKYYAAADVLLFPTTYDAFGMVVLEAMAMGVPAIVSRDAGVAELIEHTHDGLLLESPFDAAESARWLRQLQTDTQWRVQLGEAALAKAKRQSWDLVAQKTLDVYHSLLVDQ